MFRPQSAICLVWILCSAHALGQDLETRCKGDRARSIAEIKACAEAGHVPSQTNLGMNLLASGEREQGRQWLRRAAESGHAEAQVHLGVDLNVEGLPWLAKAALQGDERALEYTRQRYFRRDALMDPETAPKYIAFLKTVAGPSNKNDKMRSAAQSQLDQVNQFMKSTTMEREGYPDDPVAQFAKAKEIGNARDAWLAIIMVKGGAPTRKKDLKRADEMWVDYWENMMVAKYGLGPNLLSTLRAGADQGLPSAMRRLSEVYSKGELGVKVDERLAAQWNAKADSAAILGGMR